MSGQAKPIRLNVFFTRGMSLHAWDRIGMFAREIALYRWYQQQGVVVRFITYGDTSDMQYTDVLPGITILCNRWGLHPRVYALLIPLLHAPFLQQSDVYKTNQTNGAEIALFAAALWKKPLIARCGYMWSDHAINRRGAYSREAWKAKRIEQLVFLSAQQIVVTTSAMAENIQQRILSAKDRINVIPNYVETSFFRTQTTKDKEWDILFIGRLDIQKNLEALLEAIEPLQVRIALIGDGPLREPLEQRFGTMQGRIEWIARVPNNELPNYLQRSRTFILPSLYEGHPKTLIEAMACGLPVIGTKVSGIQELIQHKETGYLCETSSESIRGAIQEVLANDSLQEHMGQQARQFAMQHFELGQIGKLELALLQKVITSWNREKSL